MLIYVDLFDRLGSDYILYKTRINAYAPFDALLVRKCHTVYHISAIGFCFDFVDYAFIAGKESTDNFDSVSFSWCYRTDWPDFIVRCKFADSPLKTFHGFTWNNRVFEIWTAIVGIAPCNIAYSVEQWVHFVFFGFKEDYVRNHRLLFAHEFPSHSLLDFFARIKQLYVSEFVVQYA